MIWADSFTGTEVEFIVCEIQYDLKLDILFIHDALKIVSDLFFPLKWLFQSTPCIFTSRAAAESYSAFRWTCWEGDVCLLINSLDLLGRGRLSIFLPYLLIFTFNFWFNMLICS